MSNPEKISSLHDDVMLPKSEANTGEYKEYPERFDPSEKSVITRIEQFGIDIPQVEELLGKSVKELSWQEYTDLMSQAIQARYDTIVVSVYDRYVFGGKDAPVDEAKWQEMMKLIKRFEDMQARGGINLIKRRDDIGESANVVMGLEAGAHLIKTLADLKELSDKGVKLFGLQYNKPTPLADNNGLTELGRQSVKFMMDNGLIVDLAHSGKKTRQDVLALAHDADKGSQVSYTHGCVEADLNEAWKNKMGERAISQTELERIIKMGGIVGLGVTEPFFRSAKHVAERIDSSAQTTGRIDRLAIGTDFGGVPPDFMHDIKSPEDFKKLADILSADFGMSDVQINQILRTNAKDWLKGVIK